MNTPVWKYAPGFVLLASLGIAGCDRDVSPSTDTFTLTSPATMTGAALTVEPAAIVPEFLSSPFCRTPPPFRARFNVIVRPHRAVTVRGFGFEFLDRFGARTVPASIPTSTTGT